MKKKSNKLVDKYLDEDASKKIKAIEEEKRQLVWYAAGRIEGSRDRFGLVQCCIDGDATDTPTPTQEDGFIYSGPFTISCDHGCAHQQLVKEENASSWVSAHAYLSAEYVESRGTGSHGSFPAICTGSSTTALDTFLRALEGIRMADCVFVWLDSEQGFGTLVEVGYAHGLKKKIYLAHPGHVDPRGEMWFAFQAATYIMQAEDPRGAWIAAIDAENKGRK